MLDKHINERARRQNAAHAGLHARQTRPRWRPTARLAPVYATKCTTHAAAHPPALGKERWQDALVSLTCPVRRALPQRRACRSEAPRAGHAMQTGVTDACGRGRSRRGMLDAPSSASALPRREAVNGCHCTRDRRGRPGRCVRVAAKATRLPRRLMTPEMRCRTELSRGLVRDS